MAKYLVQHRRGTAEEWREKSTIIPQEGEIVIEIDEINSLHKLKIGDGIHTYAELAYLQAGDELVTQVLAEAKPRIVTVELTLDWTKVTDDKYSQVIELEGITKYSRLDLQPNADMIAEFKQLGLVFVTENNDGVITVNSVGNVPLNPYTMQATIVETECGDEDTPVVGIPIGTPVPQTDWDQTDDTKVDYIKNKPTLASVATSGSYKDLTDAPNGVLYIEGGGTTDTTNKVATWTGSHPDIEEYYPGLMIAYKIGTAGSTKTTLNINNLGAVTVVKNASTAIGTSFNVNSIILLVYTKDGTTEYWKAHDYDTNTKNSVGDYVSNNTKLYFVGTKTSDSKTSSSYATSYTNSNIYVGTDNKLNSTQGFIGDLTGTATQANADANGNVIDSTYATKNELNGKILYGTTDIGVGEELTTGSIYCVYEE